MEPTTVLIDSDDLTVAFEGQPVLDRVSLGIKRGEFIGIIGPNGAGKTTLLKALLGLQPIDSGTIITNKKASIHYVPQRGTLYNGIVPMSVVEVVQLEARSADAAITALHSVGLETVAHKRFNELSGGQQQRVIIAKALAAKTDILFLDEPTTGIDQQSQTEFFSLLKTLQKKDITIVMVSHEVETVLSLVTRVVCLNRTVLYDGSPEHFEADEYFPSFYKERHIRLHHHHGDQHA